ncbi:MAG: helix-turn-helix domain-containing protein [Telluria sp.]
MSKRKTMDKAQAREKRNRMLESAAAAELSLTEGVREMRAIAGMTQEEFARHREVSARVIKAIELGQGNPTVATLNRIGGFFGLEVAFVPVRRAPDPVHLLPNETKVSASDLKIEKVREQIRRSMLDALAALDSLDPSLLCDPSLEGAAAPTRKAGKTRSS